jgi:hypothetical protein
MCLELRLGLLLGHWVLGLELCVLDTGSCALKSGIGPKLSEIVWYAPFCVLLQSLDLQSLLGNSWNGGCLHSLFLVAPVSRLYVIARI